MEIKNTMNLQINIKEYLTDEQIQKIAEDEVRSRFRQQARDEDDVESVLSNLGYAFVYKIVKEEFDADLSELLKEKMKDVITGTDQVEFAMFYGRDKITDENVGPATKIVKEESENLRPMIREEAEKHIKEYPFYELDKNEIAETVWQVINDKLFGKEGES